MGTKWLQSFMPEVRQSMTMPQAGNLQSDPALRLKPLQESDFVEAWWNYSVAGGVFWKAPLNIDHLDR